MSSAAPVEFLLSGMTNTSGEPLAAGKVYAYKAGTLTAQSLYTAQDKSASAANPLILDSVGRANVYADGAYKLVIKDSSDNLLYTFDNLLFGISDAFIVNGGTSTGSSSTYALTPAVPLLAYDAGLMVEFVANHSNSGTSTINISALGAKTIRKGDGTVNLEADDIKANAVVVLVYEADGFFRIINRSPLEALTAGALKFLSSTGVLSVTTSDGADTGNLSLSGGGAYGIGRGAGLKLYGRDTASIGGRAVLTADNGTLELETSTAENIHFNQNSALKWLFRGTTFDLVPATNNVYSIGEPGLRIKDLHFAGGLIPATQQTYTITNHTTQRTLDCNASFVSGSFLDLLDVVGTLIKDVAAIQLVLAP